MNILSKSGILSESGLKKQVSDVLTELPVSATLLEKHVQVILFFSTDLNRVLTAFCSDLQ